MTIVKGKYCPFTSQIKNCNKDCQLFNNNECALMSMAESLSKIEKSLTNLQKQYNKNT